MLDHQCINQHHALFAIPAAAFAAIAFVPAVTAHGYNASVMAGGKIYPGATPQWFYDRTKPTQAGWYASNQDNGFVAPDTYGSENITCRKGVIPGNTVIKVNAGETIDLTWITWPGSHHGPVIDYMARCNNGDCTKVQAKDDSTDEMRMRR